MSGGPKIHTRPLEVEHYIFLYANNLMFQTHEIHRTTNSPNFGKDIEKNYLVAQINVKMARKTMCIEKHFDNKTPC